MSLIAESAEKAVAMGVAATVQTRLKALL